MRLKDIFNGSLLFRISIGISILTVIIVIVGIFFIGNTVDKIRQKRAILESRQNIQLNFEEVLAFYSREYSKLRENLDTVIPAPNDIVLILEKIEAETKLLGVEAKINNLPIELDPTAMPFVRYRLSTEANNTQLLSIIDLLNFLPVYVEIQTINSAAVDEVEFSTLARHEIIFDIFIKNPVK